MSKNSILPKPLTEVKVRKIIQEELEKIETRIRCKIETKMDEKSDEMKDFMYNLVDNLIGQMKDMQVEHSAQTQNIPAIRE